MSRYADVALPVAVDREFTYIVPPSLEASVSIGVRVIVPFGRKVATGLIVGLPEQTTVQGLKPIRGILDVGPIVSAELLRLCRWIGEYYFAPLGEVLRTANPGAFARPSRRSVTLTSEATPSAITGMAKRSPGRAQVLTLLLERGPLTVGQIQRLIPTRGVVSLLTELERAGYVTAQEMLPRQRAAMKTREFVLLDRVDGALLARLRAGTPERNTRAHALLSALQRLKEQHTNEIALQDLLRQTGTSLETFRRVAGRGLAEVVCREVRREQDFGTEAQTLSIVLNEDQRRVREAVTLAIDGGTHATFLLHGVTGSGKTQVYIECIRHALSKGKSAIVLVPEISLTPQIVRRFKSHFGERVAVVHSRMSQAERQEVWRLAHRGDCSIVIGPRSALFAPLEHLGLIVVDEEHEASYKQFDATPRYHARDVAIVRGSLGQAVVVLGSATPSVESYHNALSGKYRLLELPKRIDAVPMPDITIVDMTAERKAAYAELKASLPAEARGKLKEFQQPGISGLLRAKIQERLTRREGIILLQNRRGFAPFVECPDCGYTETCENCNVTLTYHSATKHLRCHYCGHTRRPYIVCPSCGGASTKLQGIGTQRVEQELATVFPEARVLRMDLDTTTRKGAHDRILRLFGNREVDILLGTQMVAKGLDFPHVTLVGVISADTQMLLPDFRSAERTVQLLTQVAGRAGRSVLHGEVIIQTHQPHHGALAHVVDHNFTAFYDEELESRRELLYPPFSRIILIEAHGPDEGKVQKAAERFAAALKAQNGVVTVLGPAPAVISKIKREYRWHIVIKDPKDRDPGGHHARLVVHQARSLFDTAKLKGVKLVIDADPVGLM